MAALTVTREYLDGTGRLLAYATFDPPADGTTASIALTGEDYTETADTAAGVLIGSPWLVAFPGTNTGQMPAGDYTLRLTAGTETAETTVNVAENLGA
jgi:hypothetical protein